MDKRSKAEITREEVNSKMEFDIVEKTVTSADGKEFTFPVKVYKALPKGPELLGVRSTASFK